MQIFNNIHQTFICLGADRFCTIYFKLRNGQRAQQSIAMDGRDI
jgi:hypothetical protein